MKATWIDRGPIIAGIAVAGAAAVVASGVTLASLAATAGWQGNTKWLLPAAVDVGGLAGGWVWVRTVFPEPARRFGMAVTFACLAASLLGNAAGHLLETHHLQAGPVLVIVVGAVPAVVLAGLAHLAALLTDRSANVEAAAAATTTDQSTESRSTTDTAGAEGPETPDAPAATNPDPIESTPRPPVESSIGSGTKRDPDMAGEAAAKTPATKEAPAKPTQPPSADGTWPPAEAVHVAEWDQTRQVGWLARHRAAGRTVAELHTATRIPARTIERRLQKAATQTATPPQEDPATDGTPDLQEVTS